MCGAENASGMLPPRVVSFFAGGVLQPLSLRNTKPTGVTTDGFMFKV
jgi:hypothetical protein